MHRYFHRFLLLLIALCSFAVWLVEMLPTGAIKDAIDRAHGNAKSAGQVLYALSRSVQQANFIHHFWRELTHAMTLTAIVGRCPAMFGVGIELIVAVTSQKEMVWTHARRVIAAMADLQSVWYWAEMKLPGKAVRGDASIYISTPGCDRQDAITITTRPLHCSCPLPAAIALLNRLPKAFLNWDSRFRLRLIALLTAKLPSRVTGGRKLAIAY